MRLILLPIVNCRVGKITIEEMAEGFVVEIKGNPQNVGISSIVQGGMISLTFFQCCEGGEITWSVFQLSIKFEQ